MTNMITKMIDEQLAPVHHNTPEPFIQKGVTVRLTQCEIDKVDILAERLNLSRQRLLATIIYSGIEETADQLFDALEGDKHRQHDLLADLQATEELS
jgi:hypothetical protein